MVGRQQRTELVHRRLTQDGHRQRVPLPGITLRNQLKRVHAWRSVIIHSYGIGIQYKTRRKRCTCTIVTMAADASASLAEVSAASDAASCIHALTHLTLPSTPLTCSSLNPHGGLTCISSAPRASWRSRRVIRRAGWVGP